MPSTWGAYLWPEGALTADAVYRMCLIQGVGLNGMDLDEAPVAWRAETANRTMRLLRLCRAIRRATTCRRLQIPR